MTTFTFSIMYNSNKKNTLFDYCHGIIEAETKEEALKKVENWFSNNYFNLVPDLVTIEVTGSFDFGEIKILNYHDHIINVYH